MMLFRVLRIDEPVQIIPNTGQQKEMWKRVIILSGEYGDIAAQEIVSSKDDFAQIAEGKVYWFGLRMRVRDSKRADGSLYHFNDIYINGWA